MKPNKIYVFERPDKTLWADYKLGGVQVSIFSIDTKEKAEQVYHNPGEALPDRVKSLAERKLKDIAENYRQPDEIEIPKARKKPWWKFWS